MSRTSTQTGATSPTCVLRKATEDLRAAAGRSCATLPRKYGIAAASTTVEARNPETRIAYVQTRHTPARQHGQRLAGLVTFGRSRTSSAASQSTRPRQTARAVVTAASSRIVEANAEGSSLRQSAEVLVAGGACDLPWNRSSTPAFVDAADAAKACAPSTAASARNPRGRRSSRLGGRDTVEVRSQRRDTRSAVARGGPASTGRPSETSSIACAIRARARRPARPKRRARSGRGGRECRTAAPSGPVTTSVSPGREVRRGDRGPRGDRPSAVTLKHVLRCGGRVTARPTPARRSP